MTRRARSPFHRKLWSAAALALIAAYWVASPVRATEPMGHAPRAAGKRTRASSGVSPAQPKTLIGSNIHVNDYTEQPNGTTLTQIETAIAVNPISGTICAAFNDLGAPIQTQTLLGFASSNDDGATFQDRGQVPAVPGFDPPLGPFSDPVLVWRKFDGKFYFATVANLFGNIGVWVSNDDCKTFTFVAFVVPFPVPFGPAWTDKPMLAVDNDPASQYFGRTYAVFKTQVPPAVNHTIAFSYSDDMTTWSPARALTVAPDANGAWPVVLPGGLLYVFWTQLNAGTYDIKYLSSPDGGVSQFSTILNMLNGGITPYDASVAVDPTAPNLKPGFRDEPFVQVGVGSDSCLHAVYPVGPNNSHTGDCSDVYYTRLCPNSSWSTPLKINDDNTATDQWAPTVSVGAGGIVSISYYDRRNDPANLNFRYYNRISLNNGNTNTFQPSTAVSSSASPVVLYDHNSWGDYDMQAQRPGAVYMLWADDRDMAGGVRNSDIWFQKACPQTGCTIAPAQPQQIAPLSGSRVTAHRPTFKVKLGNGATGVRVDVCRDRACTNIVTTIRATGSSVTPPADLPVGMLFWRAFGTSGLTDGLAPSATWEFRVTGLNNAIVKKSWGAEPDYNGDGRTDAAFSARDAGGKGKVYVFNSDGTASGIPAQASRVLNPPFSSDTLFGQAISSAGDLNGDGFADLVVSAGHGGSGVLYVYYGSSSGIASRPAAMISPPAIASAFGRPQAAGDVNGDGYADLLVTDAGYQGANTYGRMYTYFGGPAGLPAAPSQTFDPPASTAYYFYGYYDGSVGDVNGDGYGDVVVAPYIPVTVSGTYLYLGGQNGLRTPTQINAINGLVTAAQGIAFGDVNGDGLSDITLAVQPASGSPVVALWTGSSTAPGGINALPLVYGNAPGIMHDTDTNNDGFDDLVMAITASSTSPGVIYVYSGGLLGYVGVPPASTTTGPDGNNSGWANSLATLGDVDNDGRMDVGVGAVLAASGAGKFYLYRGTATGLSATAARTLTGTDGANSLFGGFVAGIN